MKSIIDTMWSSIYTLAQFIKVYMNKDLIDWSNRSTLLKALPFLSFHKVHIKHKGATLHAFFLFNPQKDRANIINSS